MLKFVKIFLVLFSALVPLYFIACSSGEYDLDEYTFSYTEKTIKADTIRKVVLNGDQIKEEKNDNKNSYSYVVQIGAFANQENFDRFYENAKNTLGAEVYYDQTGTFYKIRIGRFTNRADAIKLAAFVRSKGYIDAFVITRKN